MLLSQDTREARVQGFLQEGGDSFPRGIPDILINRIKGDNMKTALLGRILFMKKLLLIGFTLVVSLLIADITLAGEVDKLVNKLVEKGILTRSEADELTLEMKQETEEQKETENDESKIPEWIERTKIAGDLRLRYQYEDREEESRERGRYRLRVGVDSQIIDTVKIGFGLATGSGDPRSTNQTFTNSSEKPTARFDYAFAQWHPIDWFKITGGKMHNPLWRPSDLLWDSDITPEGVAAQIPFDISKAVELFLNTGLFIIDEQSTTADPYLFVIQPGLSWNITDIVSLKLAAAYYGIENVQGASLDHSSETNTLSGGGLAFEYNSYGVSGQIAVKKLTGFLPYLGVYGEYINNPDPDDENEGYIGGIIFGHEKIGKLWDWQLGYSYRQLEQDAWLDIFPDSDFYGGATGVKGSEAIFNLGLAKNIWLGLDYYSTENIGEDSIQEDLFQADVNFKF